MTISLGVFKNAAEIGPRKNRKEYHELREIGNLGGMFGDSRHYSEQVVVSLDSNKLITVP